MKTCTKQELSKILRLHSLWLEGHEDGVRADLSHTDLSHAYLCKANLSYANLSYSNLFEVNLSNSNLFKANLSDADLSQANLSYIKGKDIASFSFNRHTAYCFDGYIQIGCKRHTIEYWMENYKSIGKANGYTGKETKKYGQFIRSCNE